jgi:hypothetical protein
MRSNGKSPDEPMHGGKNRSILKKPSFLDIGPDEEGIEDDDVTRGERPHDAMTEAQPAQDSFLDFGRPSFDVAQNSDDSDALEGNPEYQRWGR